MHQGVIIVVPCDATASGAELAQVQLARDKLILALCAHHYGQYEQVLLSAGWRVISDTRGSLS